MRARETQNTKRNYIRITIHYDIVDTLGIYHRHVGISVGSRSLVSPSLSFSLLLSFQFPWFHLLLMYLPTILCFFLSLIICDFFLRLERDRLASLMLLRQRGSIDPFYGDRRVLLSDPSLKNKRKDRWCVLKRSLWIIHADFLKLLKF